MNEHLALARTVINSIQADFKHINTVAWPGLAHPV